VHGKICGKNSSNCDYKIPEALAAGNYFLINEKDAEDKPEQGSCINIQNCRENEEHFHRIKDLMSSMI
jgi:hypothetical protein